MNQAPTDIYSPSPCPLPSRERERGINTHLNPPPSRGRKIISFES